MNKYVLPSAAAFLILVIALSSYTPVMAVARVTLGPELTVVTIPEDDQLRQTGVMILGVGPQGTPANELYPDFLAQYKISITLLGSLVSTSGVTYYCNVAEKDKIANPPWSTLGKSVTNARQFPHEQIETVVRDVADFFVCKIRWKPGGLSVGVLDLYYTGNAGDAAFIADHIVVVHVAYTVGRQVFYGTEIQDVCVLGWSMGGTGLVTTTAGGETFTVEPNQLGTWYSCEAAALAQLMSLGLFP
jgi:hypothetical protein